MKFKGDGLKSKAELELESQIRDLDSKIDDLSTQRKALDLRLNVLRYGFDVGDKVRWKLGRTFAEGTVARVGDFCGNVMLMVNRRLKNGKEKRSEVYHWHNPIKVQNESR